MNRKNLCLAAFALAASLFSTGCQDPIQAMLGRQADMTERVIESNQQFAQALLDQAAEREDRLFELLDKANADDPEACDEGDDTCSDDDDQDDGSADDLESQTEEGEIEVAALGDAGTSGDEGFALTDSPGAVD